MKIKKGKLSDKVDSYMMVQLKKNKPKKKRKRKKRFNIEFKQKKGPVFKSVNFFF